MIPKTLSATSIQVAGLCLSRFHGEMIERARGPQNLAASLGTSVHNSLEEYVKTCILEPIHPESLKYLLELFQMHYMATFGTGETTGEMYDDGVDMLTRWFKRNDFSTFQVVSSEIKTNFPIQTSVGPIPFNYIWDRFDKIGDGSYRVVDYKTNRAALSPLGLKGKVQARCYSLAAQIEYPDATEIWVEFDMLRHDGLVGVRYTRDDNIATWKYLKAMAEKIIATDGDTAPATLNPECNYCVKKVSCPALQKNLFVGGIGSVPNALAAVDLRAQLEYQKKAVINAIAELDTMILSEASSSDVLEFESAVNTMTISAYAKRTADADLVERVIGDKLFRKYGGTSITIANLDKLLKGVELDDEKKKSLRSLIRKQTGEPSVKVKPKDAVV